MAFRLDEYECGSCGFFEGRGVPGALPPTGGRAVLPGQAEQRAPSRVAVAAAGATDTQRGWRRLKAVFLLVVFIVIAASIMYLPQLDQSTALDANFLGRALVGALVATGLAALILYVDWRAFRIVCGLIVALLAATGVLEIAQWDGKDQALLVLLVSNTLLMVALVAINFIEVRRL